MKCIALVTALFFQSFFIWGQTQLAANQPFFQTTAFDPLEQSNSPAPDWERPAYEPYVRPFITDDARVVGHQLAQLETWFRIDRESGQQWLMFAYGPSKRIEVSLGGVLGYEKTEAHEKVFSYALPLLQAKFLFREYKPNQAPGIGMVVGSFLPGGKGSFKPAGYGTFGYLTVSQCLGEGEKFLFHGNLGGNYLHIDGKNNLIGTWGVGTQIKVYKGMHFVGEVFSGDPYVPGTGTSYQTGFRYFISELIQVDMTVGEGIAGARKMPFWYSAGIRMVTERFRHKD